MWIEGGGIMGKDYSTLIAKFKAVVGDENVSTEQGRLDSYVKAGLATGAAPAFIVSPVEVMQVRDVVRLARQEKVNLVASSSGAPHFSGASLVDGDGVIVDMSKMNKVVKVNRRNKVALIEPGVTFATLWEAADKAGLKALLPLLPRANKSVLASYMERQPILEPKYHWDMSDPMFTTEVILGTAEFFRTGSAASPGSMDVHEKHGLYYVNMMGPGATDMIRIIQGAQGSLGIFNWGSVKLEVKPQTHRLYFVQGSLSALIDFSYRVTRDKLADEFFMLNSYALATMLADSGEAVDALARAQAPYTIVYGVAGYDTLPELRIKQQEEDIDSIAQAVGLRKIRRIPGATAKEMMKLISGTSPEPYYKTIPHGGFWDIAFLTTMENVAQFVAVMDSVAAENHYDSKALGIYMQPIMHGRCCHLEFTGYYNDKDEKECAKAKELYSKAAKALSEAGAFYSRPYGELSDLAYAKCPDTTVSALRRVKTMLDPDNILNRGKLCFREVI